MVKEEVKEELDEFAVKMFFKGMSITKAGVSGSGFSGIGVVRDRSIDLPVIQITHDGKLDIQLMIALRQRILELTDNLEAFVLKLVPSIEPEKPLRLAQIAIGVVASPAKGNKLLENCSIYCEDKPSPMMITDSL